MPTQWLPLFTLNAVLFPHMALPLHIFEPRYRQMIGDCLEEGHSFGVVAIREGSETGRATPTTLERWRRSCASIAWTTAV